VLGTGVLANFSSSAAKQAFEKFMAMEEDERLQKGQQMPVDQRDLVLKGATQTNGSYDAIAVKSDLKEILGTKFTKFLSELIYQNIILF
jgi:hypothetical protein